MFVVAVGSAFCVSSRFGLSVLCRLSAESVGAIRAIRAGFDCSQRLCVPVDKNFFHKSIDMLNAPAVPAFASRAERMLLPGISVQRQNPDGRSPYFMGISAPSAELAPSVGRMLRCCAPRTMPLMLAMLYAVSVQVRSRSIMRKCWHFCRGVVIRMQCSRSPRALIDIATHSRLGGQHGEEAKEGSEGGEEGREKDQAPEEEVSTPLLSLRLRTTSMTASNGPARVEER